MKQADIFKELENTDSIIDFKSENGENVNYVIKSKDSDSLIKFLSYVDEKKVVLGIESYELLSFTMEDVFLM